MNRLQELALGAAVKNDYILEDRQALYRSDGSSRAAFEQSWGLYLEALENGEIVEAE